jgi:hypothetical protein
VPYGCKACAGASLHALTHVNPGLGPRTKYASALQRILGNGLQFSHQYNPHVAAMQLYQALILKPAQQLGQPSYGSIIPGDGVAP